MSQAQKPSNHKILDALERVIRQMHAHLVEQEDEKNAADEWRRTERYWELMDMITREDPFGIVPDGDAQG